MIGKLFKYDFNVVASKLVPLYIAALIISAVSRILLFISGSQIRAFLMNEIEEVTSSALISISLVTFLYFIFIVIGAGIFIVTHLIMIQRFHNSVFGNEGYLTNTLPMNSVEIIGAKFINYIIWLFIGGAVIFITLVIAMPFEHFNFDVVKEVRNFFASEEASTVLKFVLLYFINSIFLNVRRIAQILLSITVANLFKGYKLLIGIGAFLGLGILTTIFSYFGRLPFLLMGSSEEVFSDSFLQMFSLSGISIGIEIVTIAVFFLVTVVLHRNMLNLE